MRIFDAMTYTVYYSDTADTWAPSFWTVEDEAIGNQHHITVEVTDASGIARVALGYTEGNGRWHTEDLMRTVDDPDLWSGAIPHEPATAYFVQAVDRAGNVGVATNKARYFELEPQRVYLPLVLHKTTTSRPSLFPSP
jgi:hypothetical protein